MDTKLVRRTEVDLCRALNTMRRALRCTYVQGEDPEPFMNTRPHIGGAIRALERALAGLPVDECNKIERME